MRTAATTRRDRPATVYPDTDHMAENTLQRLIAEFLRPLLERFLREATSGSLAKKTRYRPLRACWPCRVGADQFWYYREGNNKKSVSPDVFVVVGAEPTSAPPSWLLWQLKAPPLFALEIVSQDVEKDYSAVIEAYNSTGVRELIVFDPEAATLADARRGRVRVRWQVYRRDDNGCLVSVEQSHGDRVKSEALCCWLRLVGTGDLRLIRIGLGLGGEELFLTGEEHERELKEHERELKEHERELKEHERELKEHERELKEHERELKEHALALAASEHSARVALEARLQALLAERADKPTIPRKKAAARKK